MPLHIEKENQTNVQPKVEQVQPKTQVEVPQPPPQPEVAQQTTTATAEATGSFFQNQLGGFGGKLDLIRQALVKPLGGGSVNEKISKIHQLFTRVYEEKKLTDATVMNVQFIIAPSSRIGNLYGGIIVAIPVNTEKGIVIGAHLLIVESSLRPNKQIETFNGVQYGIYNTASNTVTAETVKAVTALTKLSLRMQDAEVVDAGFSVIPEEVQLTDEAILIQLLDNAAGAALTRLQLHTGSIENDIAYILAEAIRSNEVTLFATVDEHVPEPTDIANMPIRSDFRIKTVASQNNTQNQLVSQAIEIGSVDVFCSPVYVQPLVHYNNGMPIVSTRSYYNKIIIRDIKTGPEVRLSAANTFMLIATTGLLAQAGLWKRAYIPNMHIPKGQLDIRDIGAFGYEVPQLTKDGRPELIDTKSAEFTNDAFQRYMSAAFHDEVIYQIDVPDGHFLLALFNAEANGDQGARHIIYNIINGLTNGAFASLYSVNEPMFGSDDTRVINGYYLDSETKRPKSLDVIDHLAMLNMTNGDAHAMQEFEQSFQVGQSPALRLAIRTAILEELTSNGMKVRSYSTRLTMNPKFMEALVNALRTQKLFPEINNSFARQQSYVRPTADFFQRWTVDPNHIPNLFGGYGQQQQWGGSIATPYYANFSS